MTTTPAALRFAARLNRRSSAWHRIDRRRSTETHIVTRCGLEVREGEWTISTDSRVGCGHCTRKVAA